MLKKLFRFSVWLFALLFVAASFSPLVKPSNNWVAAFFGLLFPGFLCIQIAYLLIGIFSRKKWVLVTIVSLLLGWFSIQKSFGFNLTKKEPTGLSLLTWNVKSFDLYNWSNNQQSKAEMMAFIKATNADIVCLQEFYTDNNKHKNLEYLNHELGYEYYHFQKLFSIDERHWGLICLSKFPIETKGNIPLEYAGKLNGCAYADVVIKQDTIRLYNTHLKSNHFNEADYQFIESLLSETIKLNQSAKVFEKLKTGFIERERQVNSLADSIFANQKTKIVCGDFNDTPISYAYQKMKGSLTDAFVEKGLGFGKTYMNKTPFLRIDFVLTNPSISINDYQRQNIKGSDHYPVMVYFSL